jgi:hypothetical protein
MFYAHDGMILNILSLNERIWIGMEKCLGYQIFYQEMGIKMMLSFLIGIRSISFY